MLQGSMEQSKKRMGRPPSDNPFNELLHVRISGEMSEWLDVIAESRMDKPTEAQLVREAIVMLIDSERDKARKAQKAMARPA